MHLSSCRMFSVSVYFTPVKIFSSFFISYYVLMLEGAKSKFGVPALHPNHKKFQMPVLVLFMFNSKKNSSDFSVLLS